jgi:hypothetical protein
VEAEVASEEEEHQEVGKGAVRKKDCILRRGLIHNLILDIHFPIYNET